MSAPSLRARPAVPSARLGSRDLTASIVVFLVALPLCMGIAVASGVPPEMGLITGIIGGIVVGAFSGSPLQVSGPAAGLAVVVFEIVQRYGLPALGPILVLAGLIQMAAGALKLGRWFRAISPAVVHGMLAGIGVLIVVGQMHALLDAKPLPHGLANLMALPDAFLGLGWGDYGDLSWSAIGVGETALVVGLTTIGVMLGWERYRPAALRLVPGALVGVLAGTGLAAGFSLAVRRIEVPASLAGSFTLPGLSDFGVLLAPSVLVSALALAFIASAETLLSAAAVDRMHDGPRTRYDRELGAQGLGNLLCGLFGGLPMTGVIVRSSANVQAGAESRASTILHGVWILALVSLAPFVLREVPMASLAGVLVVTGARLVGLKHVRHLFKAHGPLPALIWAGTFGCVVAFDLLTGVVVGLALSMLELVPHLRNLRGLGLTAASTGGATGETQISLAGKATFLTLPALSRALDATPDGGTLRLRIDGLRHVDHTCIELIREWMARKVRAGAEVTLHPADAAIGRQLAGAAH